MSAANQSKPLLTKTSLASPSDADNALEQQLSDFSFHDLCLMQHALSSQREHPGFEAALQVALKSPSPSDVEEEKKKDLE
jgi:hypothetical protein